MIDSNYESKIMMKIQSFMNLAYTSCYMHTNYEGYKVSISRSLSNGGITSKNYKNLKHTMIFIIMHQFNNNIP